MYAAVVTSFDAPPRFEQQPEPAASGPEQLVVEVVAAALHPRVRSQADGSHYTSTGQLPLVPGIDAVVRDARGQLRYALLDDTDLGTLAERTVIELQRSVVLPSDADPIAVAAAMNPAMSSWVALRKRIDFRPGSRVLVLGATGNAGRIAIQVAKRFGASEVIGAARNTELLGELDAVGADRTVTLDRLGEASEVDVVIDYLWGQPAAAGMVELLTSRADRGAPLTWLQIGSVAGATSDIASAALRSARLQIVGSGIGSVSGRDFAAELPVIAEVASRGEFAIRTTAVPLADVEQAWTRSLGASERIVFTPCAAPASARGLAG